MKHVFLYVHDEKWYGHLSRMIKIYDLLDEKFSPVLLIWGTLLSPKNRRCYRLSYATEFEDYTDWWKKDKLNLKKRKEDLESFLSNYDDYDILLDYFPFGRIIFSEEIDMLIEKTHKTWGKVYSVMRDIFSWKLKKSNEHYDQAYNILKKHDIFIHKSECISPNLQRKIYSILNKHDCSHEAINISLKYYLGLGWIDNILVFWDQSIYDIRDEFQLSEQEKSKFLFLWYLTWNNKKITNKKVLNKPYVLVSFWGNVFDKWKFIRLLHLCSRLQNISFKLVLGSMMSDWEISSIKKKYKDFPHMEIMSFTDRFHDLFSSAKVFIWAWWYGTLMDVVRYQKPSFLFVNQNSVVKINESEQIKRITVFQDYAPVYSFKDVDVVFVRQLMKVYFLDTQPKVNYRTFKLSDSHKLLQTISG